MTIITLAITAIMIIAGGVAPGPVREARIIATPRSPIVHELIVEPTYSGSGETVTPGAVPDIDTLRHDYIADFAVEQEAARVQAYERARKVWQIDGYLAGSPMVGLGGYIVERCEAYSINPFLVPAVAEAESSCGRACLASHNAWGMIGAGGFGSWQSAIDYWCGMVNTHWPGAQSAYEMNGYCVPDYPWMPNVQGVADAIGQRQGFGGGGSSAE